MGFIADGLIHGHKPFDLLDTLVFNCAGWFSLAMAGSSAPLWFRLAPAVPVLSNVRRMHTCTCSLT